jgi:hypothetical protein
MERKTELAACLMRFCDNISEWRNFLNQVAKTRCCRLPHLSQWLQYFHFHTLGISDLYEDTHFFD